MIPLSVKRPALTLSGQLIDLEDYDHFKYQYKQYKARLGNNTDNPSRLLECLADVSKMLFSSLGPEMMNLMEAELFDNISASCMTKQTVHARTELHRIKQDPNQLVQNFLASLKSKARQCEMKLVCTNVTPSFSACSSTGSTTQSCNRQQAVSTYKRGLNKIVVLAQDVLSQPNHNLNIARFQPKLGVCTLLNLCLTSIEHKLPT